MQASFLILILKTESAGHHKGMENWANNGLHDMLF